MYLSKNFLFIFLSLVGFKVYSSDSFSINRQEIVKEFHQAIKDNNIAKVRFFLAKYNFLDLANSTDKDGVAALWIACHICHEVDLELVKLLLKYGANKLVIHPNSKATPFHCVIWELRKYNNSHIRQFIKYLIQNNFDFKTPLSSIKDNLVVDYISILIFIKDINLKSHLIARGLEKINHNSFLNLPRYKVIKKYFDLKEIFLDLNTLEKYINNDIDNSNLLVLFNIALNSDNTNLINKLVIYFNALDEAIEYYSNNFKYDPNATWPIYQLEDWIYDFINKYKKDPSQLSKKDFSYIIIKNIIKKVKNQDNNKDLINYLLKKFKKEKIKLKKNKFIDIKSKIDFQDNLLDKVQKNIYTDINIIA